MAKTITVRIENPIYELFKKAAEGQHRSISNFIEYATLAFLVSDTIVDETEMKEILSYEADLKKGLNDVKKGRYKLVG